MRDDDDYEVVKATPALIAVERVAVQPSKGDTVLILEAPPGGPWTLSALGQGADIGLDFGWEAVGRTFSALPLPESLRATLTEAVEHALSLGRPASATRPMEPNGLQSWSVEVTPLGAGGSVPPRLLCRCIAKNVETPSERRLEALHTQEALIFEHAAIGLLVVRNRVIQRANQRFCETFGLTPTQAVGLTLRAFHDSDTGARALEDRAMAAIAAGGCFEEEVRLRHRDGRAIPCVLKGRALEAHAPELGTL